MDRPNILLITADQWPGRLIGAAGRHDIDTPTLDRLAANGMRFPNAHSECPICIPARRSLMTGTDARTHGDRVFQPALTRPDLPLMADVFRDAGYQTGAVGKLHVFPPRDRMGFDEVVSYEEGRGHIGGPDDWELWLSDRGQAGVGHAHGISNNSYEFRPWHLSEDAHPTVWQARQMCRMIQRHDPTRAKFWHLSFNFPHPPLVPLRDYLHAYADREMVPAETGNWTGDMPYALRKVRQSWPTLAPDRLAAMRRAFHAQCTLIDHQIRIVIGTLREHSLLDDTIVMFTSDHGDMLGDHGLFAKRVMLAPSVGVPMILMGVKDCPRVPPARVEPRLAGLQDVMPTLLDLAGLPCPDTCTGRSLLGTPRDTLYCEALEGAMAMRMVTGGRHKLIWYPAGNRVQLFDRDTDPGECQDLSGDPAGAEAMERLTAALIANLYGADLAWVADGVLTGFPAPELLPPHVDRGLAGQRGLHAPEPPRTDPAVIVGAP